MIKYKIAVVVGITNHTWFQKNVRLKLPFDDDIFAQEVAVGKVLNALPEGTKVAFIQAIRTESEEIDD